MIEIKNIVKKYETFTALNDVSLTINDGSIFALVGVNGSGKSTLLRLIAGVFKQESGTLHLDGEIVYDNEIVKQNILFIPDNPFSSSMLSIATLKDFYSSFYKYDKEKLHYYLELFEVNNDKPLIKFSKGMVRRVYLAFALAIAPRILILDEAFDGLDPYGKKLFKQEFVKLIDENNKMIVIIATQSLRDIEDIADGYIVLAKGSVTETGDIDTYRSSYCWFSLAFKDKFDIKLFDTPLIVKVSGGDKIFNIYTFGEKEAVLEYLNGLRPLVIEENEIDLETIFILKEELSRE